MRSIVGHYPRKSSVLKMISHKKQKKSERKPLTKTYLLFLILPAMEEEQHQETGQINLLEPRNPSQINNTQKPTNNKVIFLIIAVIILALATIFVIRAANSSKWPENAATYDPVSLTPKKIGFFQTIKNFIFHSDNIVTGQQDDRINILLLGIGGPGHDGPYLSDTNIIISLKPSTKEAALISIPRDLAVKIDGHGLRKINNADAFGEAEKANNGGEYARRIFAETFNLDKALISKTTREEFFQGRAPRPFNLTLSNAKIEKLGVRMSGFGEALHKIKSELK